MIPKIINYIVVHCSDSPQGRGDDISDVHKWHQERTPPFDGVGYHYVILDDGEIQPGRPECWDGAHVRGLNHNSIGIMLFGIDTFGQQQMVELESLIEDCLERYPDAKVVGHCDLDSNKTCPNFDVETWWDMQQRQRDSEVDHEDQLKQED